MIHVIPMTTTREMEAFNLCLGVEHNLLALLYILVIDSHDILDSGRFGFVCLFLLVAIHDGDGHDEEANVGLGRKSRREGGREERREN